MRIASELKKENFHFNFDSSTCRVPTGHGNPWKSWNFTISFSRPGKSWNVNMDHGKAWK